MWLSEPDLGTLERFGDPGGRASWPVTNAASRQALAGLAAGIDRSRGIAEWRSLLGAEPDSVVVRESLRTGVDPDVLEGSLSARYDAANLSLVHAPGSPPDHLGVQILFTAHLMAKLPSSLSQGVKDAADVEAEESLRWIRRDHIDTYADAVIDEVATRSHTVLVSALPGLTRGYLDAIDEALADLTVEENAGHE